MRCTVRVISTGDGKMLHKIVICFFSLLILGACTGTQTNQTAINDDDLIIDPNETSMEYHQKQSQLRRQALMGQVRSLVQDEAPRIRGRGNAFENRAQAVQASEYEAYELPLPLKDQALNDQLMQTEAGQFFMRASARFNANNHQLAAEEFILSYQYAKDNMLKSRSLYWLAECYYSSQNWERAVQAFNFFENEYINDPLLPNVMLKKAFALENLKRVVEAQQTFSDIVAKYPETEEAKIAADQLKVPKTTG